MFFGKMKRARCSHFEDLSKGQQAKSWQLDNTNGGKFQKLLYFFHEKATVYFKIILCLQKTCKGSTELPYLPFTQLTLTLASYNDQHKLTLVYNTMN